MRRLSLCGSSKGIFDCPPGGQPPANAGVVQTGAPGPLAYVVRLTVPCDLAQVGSLHVVPHRGLPHRGLLCSELPGLHADHAQVNPIRFVPRLRVQIQGGDFEIELEWHT